MIIQGDVLEVTKGFDDNTFDGMLCDPPYGLSFMGKEWDHGVPSAEVWREVMRVLKPGAFCLVFGGTRTWHRLACALEDAGFEIRDTLMWLYGQGFPKSFDISKGIDKTGGNGHLCEKIARFLKEARKKRGIGITEADKMFCGGTTNWSWFEGRPRGQRIPNQETFQKICEAWPELKPYAKLVAEVEREVVGKKISGGADAWINGMKKNGGYTGQTEWDITVGATPEAQAWQGYGTALKPAWEPVLLIRKPLDGNNVQNALKHGCGGLNIVGSRIHANWSKDPSKRGFGYGFNQGQAGSVFNPKGNCWQPSQGRWPANLILDEQSAAMLDAQSGELHPPGNKKDTVPGHYQASSYKCGVGYKRNVGKFKDSGGAARFFYCAKASAKERNAGLEGFEEKIAGTNVKGYQGDGIHDINPRQVKARNNHPTVKPLALCRYLATLLLPPARSPSENGGARKLFVPFAGSGSEMIGAIQAGWDEVTGIEIDPDYCKIAKARIAYWKSQKDSDMPLFKNEDEAKDYVRKKMSKIAQEMSEEFPGTGMLEIDLDEENPDGND